MSFFEALKADNDNQKMTLAERMQLVLEKAKEIEILSRLLSDKYTKPNPDKKVVKLKK